MRIFATSRPTAKATPEALTAEMEAEVAAGQSFYADGLIVEAYMDTAYKRTFMILEADSVAAAEAAFGTYPHVRAGLITFEFTPIVGMPAVSRQHLADGTPLPSWWPPGGAS